MVSEKFKILLVSNAFYPEISPRSFRATELAKEFRRQGHDVVVISRHRDYDYSGFLKDNPITLKMWGNYRFPVIPIFIYPHFSLMSRLVSRILSVLFEYPAIEDFYKVRRMLKSEKGYDLMISFAVPFPVHWGVSRAVKGGNPVAKRWIADCGDPYMFNRLDRFRKPFYFRKFEINFCRRCDYLVVPYYELKTKFYPEFISKIRVIPQGFYLDDVRLADSSDKNEKPVFIFAGSIIPGKRDLTLFLDFLLSYNKDFLFIIFTKQPEWYKKYKEKLGNKLELRGYIDRLSLIYEMSKADFLVNEDTVYDSELNLEAVPSKLIDYALSKRPILNIHTKNLDTSLVMEFLEGDYKRQRVIDISKHDIKKVAERFLTLIE